MKINNAEYVGDFLYKSGFKTWFLYMFKVLNRTPFKCYPIHDGIFDVYQGIYDGKIKRQIINLCPRSGKTEINIYFYAYSFIKNAPKIIHCMYSQDLVIRVSDLLKNILLSDAYQNMYPYVFAKPIETFTELESLLPEFDCIVNAEDKILNKLSVKRFKLASGGEIRFSSIGSPIMGFGAGKHIASGGFDGMIAIDDPNNTTDWKSSTVRNNVIQFYNKVLYSRLENKAMTPLLLIQQRIHLTDLTGYLSSDPIHEYEVLKRPLVVDGVIQNPQFSEKEIRKLQLGDEYTWMSQYQQEPIMLGGTIIQRKWFNFYKGDYKDLDIQNIFITSDTAAKKGEHNDYSVVSLWGVDKDKNLYLLDMLHDKLAWHELKYQALQFYNKHKQIVFMSNNIRKISKFYIEDASSGTFLIQELARNINITPLNRSTDKVTRFNEISEYIVDGRVLLPHSKDISYKLLEEAVTFTNDPKANEKDDILDTLFDAVKYGIALNNNTGSSYLDALHSLYR